MNALIIDGSQRKTSFSERALEVLLDVFEKYSITTETALLRELKINYCRGCFGCWIKTPGRCILKDDALEITAKMIQSDLVVLFTPIHFGGYSSLLKAQMDRSIGLVLPTFRKFNGEIHHEKRYASYPSILGIGLQEEPHTRKAQLFSEHVYRNSLNYHSPHATSIVLDSTNRNDEMISRIENALAEMEVSA